MSSALDVAGERVARIYARLLQNVVLQKEELAREFQVSARTIQRDVSKLRYVLEEENTGQEILFEHGYRLKKVSSDALSNSEILAVCKILLESRSMRRDEMLPILDKLVSCCVPERNQKAVAELIANEKWHYIEPHHGKRILDGLWEIGQAIQKHWVMEIAYNRLKTPEPVVREIEPVGIMFSEYYFYLTAFLRNVDRKTEFENPDDRFPTIYRVDRICSFKVLDEHFRLPYKDRFEEGEFRKRVQFMYGGKLERIRFRYTGPSLEAVLDRLPTAEIISTDDAGWVISAEVFGKGIDMWLRSQGDYISMVKPSV